MVVDLKDVVPFLVWLPGALLTWLLVVACVAAGTAAAGWLVSAMRHGPRAATLIIGKVLRDALLDWVYLSPRRVWALARLAIQESIRRRVVVVFAVFILILLFAGWFLDPGSVDPARLYLGSVLTLTSYLVLLLALLLSSLSLPADIKNRTLHTVVTKPVRASEVVLGRIVGFAAVGTLLLAVMGAVNYVFVERGLTHTHQLTADNLHPVEGRSPANRPRSQGRTSRVHQHRHKVTIDPEGQRPRGDGTTAHARIVGAEGRQLSPWPAGGDAVGPRARLRKAHFPRSLPVSRSRRASTWVMNGRTAVSSRRDSGGVRVDLRGNHRRRLSHRAAGGN